MPLLLGASAVLGLALGISAAGVLPGRLPLADVSTDPADGYPLRIARPWMIRDLPARPGPVAGLLRSDESWLAVSPHGRLWELADDDDRFDVAPAVSDDGRVLAYLRTSEDGFGEYVLRDLTTGVITAFPSVSSAGSESDATFWAAEQHPAYVSPDGDQVLVRGGRTNGRDADGLLLSVDAGVRELFVAGPVHAAGWLRDGRLAWLDSTDERRPAVIVTTDTGEAARRTRLAVDHRIELTQWSARASPDGGYVALTEKLDGRGFVGRFSLRTGLEVDRSDVVADAVIDNCPTSWRGEDLTVPTTTGDETTFSTGVALVDPRSAPVVLADPRLNVGCSLWASQALDGDVHRGLSGRIFDDSQVWWSWWWRELAAVVLIGFAIVGAWWRRTPTG